MMSIYAMIAGKSRMFIGCLKDHTIMPAPPSRENNVMHNHLGIHKWYLAPLAVTVCMLAALPSIGAKSTTPPQTLFNGHSLDGWKASGRGSAWHVEQGKLVGRGGQSLLYYMGNIGNHSFRNFDLKLDVYTESGCDSGLFFHAAFQESGPPTKGYELQICNASRTLGAMGPICRTGGLTAVRDILKSSAADKQWTQLRLRVVGNRITVWVNGQITVDYIQPGKCYRTPALSGRVLSRGTVALQANGGRVLVRRISIRLLDENADAMALSRASGAGYDVPDNAVDRTAATGIPVVDYHVHLRGGMTTDKAIARQAVTGVNIGVLRNLGNGWPLETDDQLRTFLNSVHGQPLFVGLQVNDRNWFKKHSPDLLKRFDYFLGDTMIMPMPNDDSKPVKLWMSALYTIDDAESWMERYVRHNLRVLSEPITILANPTYLPPSVASQYDQLWTNQRMRQVIQAAIDNHVALEINARSGLPHPRFIRLAKQMGANFSFGSNNFDDRPISMARYFEAIDRYGLTKDDMLVPAGQ